MTKPTLLAVSPVYPWPAYDGFTLRATRLLEELRSCWEIDLLTDAPWTESKAEAWLTPHHVKLQGSVRGIPWGYTSEQLVEAAKRLCLDRRFDAVLLWGGTEVLLPYLRTRCAVVDRIDCAWLTTWREARLRLPAAGAVKQFYWAALTAQYERWFASSGNCVVVVGDADAAAMRRLSARANIHVVPNGVDVPDPSSLSERSELPTVIFTGVMSFAPNCEAVEWFVANCWPLVRSAVADAQFRIVGRNPGPRIEALASHPGIEVTGGVESVTGEIARSWVAVAPMRSGAGIKNKVLEAWATSTPVVMTPLAISGLALPPDHSGLVVGEADRFAHMVVHLLQRQPVRTQLGISALEVARQSSWEGAARSLSHLLESSPLNHLQPFPSARRYAAP